MTGRERLEILFEHKPHECCYCAIPLTLHTGSAEHILPVSMGGNDHFKNLEIACKPCNGHRSTTFNVHEFIKKCASYGIVVAPDRPVFQKWKMAYIRHTVGPRFRMT